MNIYDLIKSFLVFILIISTNLIFIFVIIYKDHFTTYHFVEYMILFGLLGPFMLMIVIISLFQSFCKKEGQNSFQPALLDPLIS